MIELLDQAAIDALIARFSGFHDAVLGEVVLHWARYQENRYAKIQIQAEDVGRAWRTVTMTIPSLREYKFYEGPKGCHAVLSFGLRVYLLDKGVFIDLEPRQEAPSTLTGLRSSHQYVVGDSCSVEITEASEW